jgi:hypothetical protein
VIEPAAGVNRTVLALLMDAYSEKHHDKGESRVPSSNFSSFNGADHKSRVLPLAKNKTGNRGDGQSDLSVRCSLSCAPCTTTPWDRQVIRAAG